MANRSQRRRGRPPVKQDRWVAAERAALDADGYALPGPNADVIVEMDAGTNVGPDSQRSRWFRFFGLAPANSPLGQTLATVPLCLLLAAPTFATAAASAVFVKITWVTAIALFVGLGVGVFFALRLTRQRPAIAAPSATVVRSPKVHSAPMPQRRVPPASKEGPGTPSP